MKNQLISDALYAAAGRLIPPHETESERRDSLGLATIKLDEAVMALLEASREFCRADDTAMADLVDDARHSVGVLSALASKRAVENE